METSTGNISLNQITYCYIRSVFLIKSIFTGMPENSGRLAKDHTSSQSSSVSRRGHEDLAKVFFAVQKIRPFGIVERRKPFLSLVDKKVACYCL